MEIHAYIDQFLIEQGYNGSFLFAYEGTIRLCKGYGYGWMIYSGRRNTVYHNGSLAGFRSTLYRNTEKDAVLIALSNLGDTGLEPIERLKRSIASWL
ncbi:beta-lactamase family protein [Paenibacillus apiarius]|uniref:Beta-lactamase family protein n=1 Tax=Paenibacillus apiarius TaxID=46240 RepID=A0ABT4DMD0_9BACL|nr:beta-lactamase family protein [Paenibacillus apiarius]MCY9516030.1 beta-lactamase family protein [Paenibacillus apiarius]MCY9518511.1 beta-lactamase family protein [Paenibacillus apiarius]MCY9551088.1 beta-lactamase family protein [Paenibacillus apiarius]MCY9558242.1 beta-lactamase family protein [Paenibacillus apiarius]MCY9684642.1 beta-lactamase family protein [Paenibacillus apiarius]